MEINSSSLLKSFIGEWMTTGFDTNEPKFSLDASHRHHFACNIIERQTEKCGVTGLNPQEITGNASRVSHLILLDPHLLRFTGRATGMYQHPVLLIFPYL